MLKLNDNYKSWVYDVNRSNEHIWRQTEEPVSLYVEFLRKNIAEAWGVAKNML